MTHIPRRPRRLERGMTLIEVLVTLVLISVGLLGVAALQLTSLRGNQEAYVRSQASALAGYILDRMRANPQAFRAGAYNVAFNATGTAGTTAGNDLSAWQNEINRLLPGGNANAAGSIATVAGSPNIVTITIRWSERQDDFTVDTLPTFQTRTEI